MSGAKGLSDARFEHVQWDPKFRRMAKQERKVQIDKRFEGMFSEPKFVLEYSVDRRGRPMKKTSSDHLRKFYHVQSDDDEQVDEIADSSAIVAGDSQAVVKKVSKKKKKTSLPVPVDGGDVADSGAIVERGGSEAPTMKAAKKKKKKGAVKGDTADGKATKRGRNELAAAREEPLAEDSDASSDEEEEGSREIRLDLARGEGNVSSSSDSSEWELDDAPTEHPWGELDADAPAAAAATARLAVCHADFDRLRAADLLVLLGSFAPAAGRVLSVRVYPSELGAARLADEDRRGPRLPVWRPPADQSDDDDDDDDQQHSGDDDTEGKLTKSQIEQLRAYQLERLRFFYAVAECDSAATAAAIYDACDGFEYENSSTRLDLRFVPDETAFERAPTDEATAADATDGYRPCAFETAALHKSRVRLTWDETDPRRTQLVRRAFAPDAQLDSLPLSNYLASGSSSEGDADEQKPDSPPPSKYRQLLGGTGSAFASKPAKADGDDGTDMVITWDTAFEVDPPADEPADDAGHESATTKHADGGEGTPWERYLQRRKEKKRQRRADVKRRREAARHGSDDDSDAEEPLRQAPETDASTAASQLELLVRRDDGDEKRHFKLKDLQKEKRAADKLVKGRRRRGAVGSDGDKEGAAAEGGGFRLRLDDGRFDALFADARFNVDPSSAHFSNTLGSHALVAAKLQRAAVAPPAPAPVAAAPSDTARLLSSLRAKSKRLRAD